VLGRVLMLINELGNKLVTKNKATSKRKISESRQLKLIDEIQKNISRWYAYFSHNITEFRHDRDFYNGEQWDGYAESQYRNQGGKFPYMFNLLKPLGRQILGEQANMEPSLDLIPSNVQTANVRNDKLIQGLLKKLAYSNDMQQHYSTALENMISGGWAVLLVGKEYEDRYKFDQKPSFCALDDPTNTFFDPNAKDIAKTNGDFFGYWEVINEDDFTTKYPGVKYSAGGSLLGEGRQYCDYVDSKSVVIVQYYKRDFKSKTLVQLTNHIDFKIEVLEEDIEQATEEYLASRSVDGADTLFIPPLVESNRRKTQLAYIKAYKATNLQVFDESEWPSERLPGVFIPATRFFKDGKEYCESFIHEAKDAQKTYNYCLSEAINALARSRREQVWMTERQSDGYEEILQYPDRQQSHLPFNPDPTVPGGIPIFRPPEEISEAFFKLAEQAREDVYRTLGIYASNRGELPNQTSGLAIGRTIFQGNLALIKILNNFYDGQTTVGKIILDLIPKLYDTERVVTIVDGAGKSSNATINQVMPGGYIENNVADTAYDLEVQPVANFAIQQQMISENLFKLASISPEIPNLVADLIAGTLDSSVKTQLIDRLQNLVPAPILAKEKGNPPPPEKPNPQEQMQLLEMQKIAADIKKTLAEAQATLNKTNLDHRSHVNKSLIEAEKLEATRQADQTDLLKTVIKSHAEIKKQKLSNMGDLINAMTVLKKTGPPEKGKGSVH